MKSDRKPVQEQVPWTIALAVPEGTLIGAKWPQGSEPVAGKVGANSGISIRPVARAV